MKREKELVWLCKLGKSKAFKDNPFKGDLKIFIYPMTKREIADILKVSINDKHFNYWINKLVEEEVLHIYGKKIDGKGNSSNTYGGDISDIIRYIQKDNLLEEDYDQVFAFMNRGRVI